MPPSVWQNVPVLQIPFLRCISKLIKETHQAFPCYTLNSVVFWHEIYMNSPKLEFRQCINNKTVVEWIINLYTYRVSSPSNFLVDASVKRHIVGARVENGSATGDKVGGAPRELTRLFLFQQSQKFLIPNPHVSIFKSYYHVSNP